MDERQKLNERIAELEAENKELRAGISRSSAKQDMLLEVLEAIIFLSSNKGTPKWSMTLDAAMLQSIQDKVRAVERPLDVAIGIEIIPKECAS